VAKAGATRELAKRLGRILPQPCDDTSPLFLVFLVESATSAQRFNRRKLSRSGKKSIFSTVRRETWVNPRSTSNVQIARSSPSEKRRSERDQLTRGRAIQAMEKRVFVERSPRA
jgi:hypothetical protein